MSVSDGRSRRRQERRDPWERLVEHSDAAVAEGREVVARAVRSALDEPDGSRPAVRVRADRSTCRYLGRKGIRYVLPVVCSPFAEPVASADPKYWLRHPSGPAPGPDTGAAEDRHPPGVGALLGQGHRGGARSDLREERMEDLA